MLPGLTLGGADHWVLLAPVGLEPLERCGGRTARSETDHRSAAFTTSVGRTSSSRPSAHREQAPCGRLFAATAMRRGANFLDVALIEAIRSHADVASHSMKIDYATWTRALADRLAREAEQIEEGRPNDPPSGPGQSH